MKKSKLNFLKKNNKGSSFVLVLVSVALVMILVAIIFVMIIMQFRMTQLSRQSKDNFYYLEEVLDEMRVGVGNESVKQLKTAYDETVSMVVYYDTNQQKYMSVSSDSAENIMDNKFFDNLETVFKKDEATLRSILLSYVQDIDTATCVTSQNVAITFPSGLSCEKLESSNPKKTIGYTFKNICVSRKDEKGNLQSISTDISVYPPKQAMNFLASGDDYGNVFTYALVADSGVHISGGATTNVRYTGNIYAGADYRNNGIYHGSASTSGANKTVVNSKAQCLDAGTKGTDASNYSGIFVTGTGTTLNLQSDIIAVNGSITADSGAEINGNKKSDVSNRATSANIWAKNIATTGSSASKINLQATCNISDDLELNADDSDVSIDGWYYGYGYGAEDEWTPSATTEAGSTTESYKTGNQISAYNKKAHSNSSAIIINGENSVLDLSKLTELLVNGRSYIDLVNEERSTEAGADADYTDVDIQTAESISVKSTQLVYRVLESPILGNSLSTLNTGDAATTKVGSDDNALTYKVPYYNMIKFLTYQFFKDGGYNIYKGTSPLKSTTWTGIGADDYETVDADIIQKGASSAYYADIMKVYFPTKNIIKNGSSGSFVSADDNTTVSIEDCYGNKYSIYKNSDELKTNAASGTLHRYGFVTVGEKYDQISLVRTIVGKNKDEYYYYQFYDAKAREQFVKDYAKYTADKGNIDDVSSLETFKTATIALPDSDEGDADVFTRGLGTVLNATTSKYEIVPSQTTSTLGSNSSYWNYVDLANVYKCYFPKSNVEATITHEDWKTNANDLYYKGKRQVKEGAFSYGTEGEEISPLTNPDCVDIRWDKVAENECNNGGLGAELVGYTGARVWVSTSDVVIDGSTLGNKKTTGIILSMGDVTFKNMEEFRGTVICAGKVYISGNLKFYADDQMCNGMIENDKNNMIRTCLGLDEFQVSNDNSDNGTSITRIEYTDLVGFENWTKNAE